MAAYPREVAVVAATAAAPVPGVAGSAVVGRGLGSATAAITAYAAAATASPQNSSEYDDASSAAPSSGAAVVPRFSANRYIAKIMTCRCCGVSADSIAAAAGRYSWPTAPTATTAARMAA